MLSYVSAMKMYYFYFQKNVIKNSACYQITSSSKYLNFQLMGEWVSSKLIPSFLNFLWLWDQFHVVLAMSLLEHREPTLGKKAGSASFDFPFFLSTQTVLGSPCYFWTWSLLDFILEIHFHNLKLWLTFLDLLHRNKHFIYICNIINIIK